MKRKVIAGTIALGVLISGEFAGAAAQQTGSQPEVRGSQTELAVLVSRLAVEIRTVRLELQMLQLDYSGRLLAGLEQETQWLQTQRRKLETREARVRENIARLAEQLSNPALSSAERQALLEIQASRDLKPDSELARVLAEKDTLGRREAEVARQIQTERQKWDQARLTAGALQNELAQMQRPAAAPAR